jgi:hypothetical protein
MKQKSMFVTLIMLSLCWSQAAYPQSTTNRPVMVGGSSELDACGAVGVPQGLNPKGDNFLAVKSAPNISAKRKTKLTPGQQFIICEYSADEKWIGILVPIGKMGLDACQVTGPIAKRQVYRGPCMQGWVAARYVQVVAG